MRTDPNPSFAFLVLAFNHQHYIIEHLESIKYLVERYAKEIDVDLHINDDCSKDRTRELVDQWIEVNSQIFRHVSKTYNTENKGTCASIDGLLSKSSADMLKICAGDDVFSCENIFTLTRHEDDIAMVSGRTLLLVEGLLVSDSLISLLETASEVIYRRDGLLHRFKHLQSTNAPNTLYAESCLKSEKVREYLKRFDVIEDWPLQLAISRQFPNRRFKLINKVLVYYRKTMGSTYYVANKRFFADMTRVYDDLIHNEESWIDKLRLRSRKFCFELNKKRPPKYLNVDTYFFIFSFILNLGEIISAHVGLRLRVGDYMTHYGEIRRRTKRFLEETGIDLRY